MSEEITFYTNPMSRGRIARWMLEETGVPYRTEILTFGGTMKGADYLSVNPMGKVPAIRHGTTIVTECAAICAYLADTFPQAGLAPQPDERADYYRWMFFAAGPMEMAVTNRALGFEIPTERLRMAGCGSLDHVFATLERAVSASPFIAGDRFTAADVYVGSAIDWGLAFKTIPARPAFAAYAERFRARDAYVEAKAIDNRLIEEMRAQG